MDLTTKYLGLTLPHPIVPSAAQPLTKDLDSLKRLEDGGAPAVVIHSLFEEQIEVEAENLGHYLEHGAESYAEAISYYPSHDEYVLGPTKYLDHIQSAKEALDIPVIGSLNGVSAGGWTEYAAKIEEAGADAIELNVYYLPTDPRLTGEEVEAVYVDVVKAVKSRVGIPVAAKIGPFFSSMANFAKKLEEAGADGLSLFNRFYQPIINPEELTVDAHLELSTSSEILLPLRWIAILRQHTELTLSATSGLHSEADALRLIMAGADVTHLCAAILKYGPQKIGEIRDRLATWLEEHEYNSLDEARGSMSQANCPEPAAFERANYMKAIHRFVPPA
jgi:dihydroorotate dehydrogenase (fumarate)